MKPTHLLQPMRPGVKYMSSRVICTTDAEAATKARRLLDRGGYGTPPNSIWVYARSGGREFGRFVVVVDRDAVHPSEPRIGRVAQRLGGAMSGAVTVR